MLDSAALMLPDALRLVSSVATGFALGTIALALGGPLRARRVRSRARRIGWLAGARSCCTMLPWAVALATGAAWLGRPGAFDLPLGVAAIGAFLLLGAGRIEQSGRLATARALARLGGQILFWATGLWLALRAVEPIGGSSRSIDLGLLHESGVVVLALGATAGLLGGLAGKPRPSGAVAAALSALGGVALLLCG